MPLASNTPRSHTSLVLGIIAGFALLKLGLHLWVNASAGYGYFRDELYYLACADHLDWGYVDHPPFSVWLLYLGRSLLGDDLFSLRLIPAVAGALNVLFTGLLIREMGGGVRAATLGCIAVIAAPIHLAMNGYYSMNALDLMLWTLSVWILLRTLKHNRWRYWLTLGLILGIGLLNKISFLWLGVGLLVGLLLTKHRKTLLTPKPYAAGALALLLFLPYVIWNTAYDFPHLEFMENALNFKYNSLNRIDFLMGQLLLSNPLSLVLWGLGLFFFIGWKSGRSYLIIGVIFLSVFLILIANSSSKAEYLGAAYPMIFAGGAVMLEYLTQTVSRRWIAGVYAVLLLGVAGFVAPMALPVLPVERFVAYQSLVGLAPPNSENKELSELPQFFADMHGWEEMAQTVSQVYQSLSESEQKHAVVFAENYGEAGAMDFFRSKYPLPPVVSPHNSYWLWGYGETPIEVVLIIGGDKADHLRSCLSVESVATFSAPYVMPYENNHQIWVGREMIRSFEEIWRESKNYN